MVVRTAQCDELPSIVNGFITYAADDGALYDIGTVATYECNPGFILVGEMTRDCVGVDVNTAEFNREAPVCICTKYCLTQYWCMCSVIAPFRISSVCVCTNESSSLSYITLNKCD